mgnify:CR=1 FL=1
MRTVLEWKCGYCNSFQKSDSGERWRMDTCKCGKSAVDLEDGYQRCVGEVIELSRANFGSAERLGEESILSDFEKMLTDLNKRKRI